MIILYQNVKKFLEQNTDLLEVPNELIAKASFQLSVHEVAELMRVLHESAIDFDSSIVAKAHGYINYNFSFDNDNKIIDDFYTNSVNLTKELFIDDINKIDPTKLNELITDDQYLKKCYQRRMNWGEAKAPYIITVGLTIDEQSDRIYSTLSINSADMGSSIELYYPKVAGKLLRDVGYMYYDSSILNKQAESFKDQLERIVDTWLKK